MFEGLRRLISQRRDDDSGETASAPRTRILTREGLYDLGSKLAAEHGGQIVRRAGRRLYKSLESNCNKLEVSYGILTELDQEKRPLTPGVEWFLDNYHIVEKHILDLRNHFPPSYDRSLPKLLKGTFNGYPRVYQLALEFLENTDSVLEVSLLNSLLRGYQDEGVVLTIGEVWAVPIMLRLALLESLETLTSTMISAMQESHAADRLIEEIIGEEGRPGTEILLALAAKVVARPDFLRTGAANLIRRLRDQGPRASLTLQWLEERLRETGREPEEILRSQQYQLAADQISIANVVNSLKALSYINWQEWFEETNKVELVLRKDPSGVHAKSDFKTRDLCRHKIEKYARKTGKEEVDIAGAAVELAAGAGTGTKAGEAISRLRFDKIDKRTHTGYYLLSDGRAAFERAIHFRPGPLLAFSRFCKSEAFLLYSLSIFVLSFLLILKAMVYSVQSGGTFALSIMGLCICIVPATEIVGNFVQWVVCHLTVPSLLAKYDFSETGIPKQFKTAVVVHVLLSGRESLQRALDALYVRYLANNDPQLIFGLLADFKDSETASRPSDDEIRELSREFVDRLNKDAGAIRFFVLFRRRLWNEAEGVFMAWERKRGKVEEFNRLILGDNSTTFETDGAPVDLIRQCRFVITLDADGQLPRGTAHKLVGAMAHPLNRPVLDPERRVVTEGFGIIQPRVGVSLSSAHQSLFSMTFSGHSGLDPYTQSVSDVYQDLFGEASYIGKGIYDVKAFAEATDGRVPENALLSHDLFEGGFARCALATDIELFDDFPSKYHVHAKRQHRWIRGDWQLLRWIFNWVPDSNWKWHRNPLSGLARWKLLDNLRRSLVAPSILALLVASWTILPGSPLFWTLLAMLVVAFPVYANLAQALIIPPLGLSIQSHVTGVGRDMYRMSKQAVLTLAFLPHQALLSVHAIILTLYRSFLSRRHLLEWETHLHSERRLKSNLASFLVEMAEALILTTAVFLAVVILRVESLIYAAPFLLMWVSSPFIAAGLSRPLKSVLQELEEPQRQYLRQVGYDTWKFFRENLNEENNFLIPDNVQLVPNYVIARRTSPTNISLSMLGICSAYDLGFLPSVSALGLMEKVIRSLQKLEKFKGQFLNWYGTDDLRSLYPRYISMVDSGNLLGHFVALLGALGDFERGPFVSGRHLQHISILLKNLRVPEREGEMFSRLAEMGDTLMESRPTNQKIARVLSVISRGLPNVTGTFDHLPNKRNFLADLSYFAPLHDLFAWVEVYEALKADCHIETKALVTEGQAGLWAEIDGTLAKELLSPQVLRNLLPKIRDLVERLSTEDTFRHTAAFLARCEELSFHAGKAEEALLAFDDSSRFAAASLEELIQGMDFRFLFDEGKNLFVIGYNVDSARRDNSFYDLLASEARLGSFMAIALNQVPQQHWFALGRGLSESAGGKALLSWSGTMFEYIMPLLVMKDFPGTLLSETYKSVVRAQQVYARRYSVPWGISESGYSGVDFEKTYQYHAFGVPGLGLKRGLDDNLVISPYSTFLALMIAPQEGVKNLHTLESEGARGPLGFFEAVDYTGSRLVEHEDRHIVRSFLAHHQGMSLIALNNVLNNGIFQERFHRDPRVRSCELLLHERFPERLPTLTTEESLVTQPELREEAVEESITYILSTPHTSQPRTHLVSNGQYTVMVDHIGSGFSIFDRETHLTRWREDPLYDSMGTYFFVRDLETLEVWSTTFQPTKKEPESYEAIFTPDKAEYKRKDNGIFIHTEITVSPEDNVEVRRTTVANLSKKRRTIELTSYGEVALAPRRSDAVHPAFSKMFIESKWHPEIDALSFSRRPRSAGEETLHFVHSVGSRVVWSKLQYESSRVNFLGRGNTLHHPAAFESTKPLSGTTGYVLDPIFSIRTQLELAPGESETVTFYSAVAQQKEEVIGLVQKYKDAHQVARAFEMAWSQSSVELRNERMSAGQAQAYQRLANALLFNLPRVRGRVEVIRRNKLTQDGLWRFGISGDLPIALVFLSEPGELRIVRDLLTAHYYLRTRGFQFDLVIVNEYPGGYMQNLQEELEQIVKASLSAQLIDKNGGVFIRTSQQMSREERDLLESVARVVLHGGKGSLSAQLKLDDSPEEWVPFERRVILPQQKPLQTVPPENMSFYNGIGGFTDGGKIYNIQIRKNKLPPAPWSNIIANPSFGTLVTETGAGYTWADNSRENRLTPWSNDPVCDPPYEVIFLRDVKNGGYWCPTPGPVRNEADYSVEHGFGFTRFRTEIDGIQNELLITISPEEQVKWWQLKLTNTSGRERNFEAYLYVEWVLGVLREDSYRFHVTAFDEPSETLYVTNSYNNEFGGRVAFIGSDHHISSYTGRRSEFVGRFRDLTCPAFLEKAVPQALLRGIGKHEPLLTKRVGAAHDSSGIIQVPVTLAPGKSETVRFFLGVAPSQDAFRSAAGNCCAPGAFERAFDGIQEFYRNRCGSIQVSTPDPSFDLLLNGWLQYQNVSCRIFGRTAFYQSGGAFGFRDQLQDSMALLDTDPDMTRKAVMLHASRQFVEGDVQHWWHPPTGRGVRTRMSDDFLWLPFAVTQYIRATGYRGILDEEISYLGGQHLQEYEHEAYIVPYESDQRGSIYEHCVKAIDRALKFGEHGLPLMGSGDWNDGMNEVGAAGRGESVWLGWFLLTILREFTIISEEVGDIERHKKYSETIFFLQNAMEKDGWDGSWYRRAFFDNGTPLGSAENEECRIDSLTQSWAVISGMGNPQRAEKAMNEVYEQLVDEEHGLIRLLTPPFDKGGLKPGYIKGYLPGIRENGAQYTHAAAWVVMATAILGKGEKAVSLFNMINPINHTSTPEGLNQYKGEPYAMAGDVYSVFPYAGRAGWTWYTGSAGWMYQVGLDHILGLKVLPGCFTVDPCVAPSWKNFRIELQRGNVTYRIKVENPDGVERGVKEVRLDDQVMDDKNVPLIDSALPVTREVKVVMG